MAAQNTEHGTRNVARSKTAVLYARVSSKDQEREGYSIPAQKRLLRDIAVLRLNTHLMGQIGQMAHSCRHRRMPLCANSSTASSCRRSSRSFAANEPKTPRHCAVFVTVTQEWRVTWHGAMRAWYC